MGKTSSKRNGKRTNSKRSKGYVPKSVKQFVKKQFDKQLEDKFVDVSLTTNYNSINNVWIETDLTNIGQGTAAGNRIGRRIRIKSLEIRGCLTTGASESLLDDPYNVVRCVIATFQGSAGTTPLVTGSINLSRILKKDILQSLIWKYYDKYIPLQVTSTEKGSGDGYTPQVKQFKYYKRFKNLYITYATDGASTGDKRLMLAFASDSSASVNPGFIVGYYRLTFEDA